MKRKIMNTVLAFFEALGFDQPRQTQRRDIIEIVVTETMKPALKKLRSGRVKMLALDKATTSNSVVHEFLAAQDRQTVGRVRVESFRTHSVIQLTNYAE